MSKSGKTKPISRKFWSYLNYLPQPLRGMLVRAQFEVDYELPEELIFKQAETADEITQALRIVYDSYVDLDYIEVNDAKMRVTKYHALPTTIILVAKWHDEVVGTISIIPDTAMGIPSEQTWNLDKYKANGQKIAEISSLAIKKGFRRKRGKLLFPLCKIMYLFCTEIFKFDGIIASATHEVEAFYIDILLFKKVQEKTGQNNILVKGNPSTCCYLPLDQGNIDHYKKVYGKKNKKYDLYSFLYAEKIKNIQLPDRKKCLQSYTNKQNISLAEILKDYPFLTKDFTEKDKMILKNIDIADSFTFNIDETSFHNRGPKRYHVRQQAWLFEINKKSPMPVYIADLSETGLKIILSESIPGLIKDQEIILFFENEKNIIQLSAKIQWIKNNRTVGCHVTSASEEWKKFSDMIFQELTESNNVIAFKPKKVG